MFCIRTYTSARELENLRSLWETLAAGTHSTIFQSFDWNLLAIRMFGRREEPFMVCAETSYGAAIVPAVVRRNDRSVRLVGEELFDYRSFLHQGEDEVLRAALAALAQLDSSLDVVAVREGDRRAVFEDLELIPFTAAPLVSRSQVSAEDLSLRHNRLWRNLRRLRNQGFELKVHSGHDSALLRSIYEYKAMQDPDSLFHDRLRVEFIVEAARLAPECCEIFTLECRTVLAAALVTFHDHNIRRFYTCFYDPSLAKLSPALCLMCEVTRQSLEAGMDCDYMTGEQGYKLRLATSSVPLYRLKATSEQLGALSAVTVNELPLAG